MHINVDDTLVLTPFVKIAGDERVPIADRIWLLARLLYERDPRLLVTWAVDCAWSALGRLDGETRAAAECALQTALAWCDGSASAEDCREAADYADAIGSAYVSATAVYSAVYSTVDATRAVDSAVATAVAIAYATADDSVAMTAVRYLECSIGR